MRNFEFSPSRRVASAAAVVALATFALAGCGSEWTVNGTVAKGANGKEYVVPNNAHRPVYKDKADCEADVKAHEAQIEQATGATVDPNKACQPVTEYHPVLYPRSYVYGVMTSPSDEWKSTKVVVWSPVRSGQFAAPEDTLQHDVATAPDGAEEGSHTSVTERTGIYSIENDGGGAHGGDDDPHIVVVDR